MQEIDDLPYRVLKKKTLYYWSAACNLKRVKMFIFMKHHEFLNALDTLY